MHQRVRHDRTVLRVVLAAREHGRPHGVRPSGDDGVVAVHQEGL